MQLLLRCKDDRLSESITRWMKDEGIFGTCYDPIFIGGCQLIAMVSPFVDTMYSDISFGSGEGNVDTIILMGHTDCAAYGSTQFFTSDAHEIACHEDELRTAIKAVEEHIPDVTVRAVLAIVKGEEVVEFRSIK